MGDIHGAYGALLQCLQRARFNYEEDTLIQLGDVTDRNDQVFECVEELLKIKKLIQLKGNHDDWFLQFLRTGKHPMSWKGGAMSTVFSYLKHAGKEAWVTQDINGYVTNLYEHDVPATHRAFYENMRPYYIDETGNCFVHAGFDRAVSFMHQQPEEYYWNRTLWAQALSFEATRRGNKDEIRFKMVEHFHDIFIGHTNLLNWDTDQPMRAANIWNIDTGAGQGARLTIMDVYNYEYWQSDPVDKDR